VDFGLDESQREVARLAAEVLSRDSEDPWKELAQAGLLALPLPADLGGDELGIMDVAALATEIGRKAAPVPALATLFLGLLPVLYWGDPGLLPAVAAGETIITGALSERGQPFPGEPAAIADGERVSGTKIGVSFGYEAALVVVTVSLAAGGTGAVLVDPRAEGVSWVRTPSSSEVPEYTMRLERAPVAGRLDVPDVRDLYRLAAAGACCLTDGALAGALELTTGYVGSRRQFGRPLAEFQAVSQQIADVYIASRTLHLATQSACWRLAAGLHAAEDLDVAAYWACAYAPAALRTCHHLHGGLGMDVSYPLHRYSSLVSDLVRFLGGAEYRLERVDVH
jgi:3-oxo-4-pregnene-20-carboxyl-CoA dehydrogenase alpha subunit